MDKGNKNSTSSVNPVGSVQQKVIRKTASWLGHALVFAFRYGVVDYTKCEHGFTGECAGEVGFAAVTLLAPQGKILESMRGAREAEAAAKAARDADATAKAARLAANKAAGDAARDALADTMEGSVKEKVFDTELGTRRLDVYNPKTLKGYETKVGRTSYSKSIELQVDKDAQLLADDDSKVDSIEWVFSKSETTGLGGPTSNLQKALAKAGITWRMAP